MACLVVRTTEALRSGRGFRPEALVLTMASLVGALHGAGLSGW
jgi:hypothetical protein